MTQPSATSPLPAPILRTFAWSVIAITFAFLLNCYLTYWQKWPGLVPLFEGSGTFGVLGWLQTSLYLLAIVISAWFVLATAGQRGLRDDAASMTAISTYIIGAAFWGVFMIGIADAIISFLRVEGMLQNVVGSDLATKLGRSIFRGTYVHIPLIVIGMVIAGFRRRCIDFIWLALLVVVAELVIVITRFIFSYEQAFMGDLVRFWYAALFLFASAYTLLEDGHVRVDVVYAGFSRPMRGRVNATGAIVLGFLLCWTILIMGMWTKSSILISPVLGFEVSQSGFGMYIKYLMAGFLSIFAVTMMIQFAASLLDAAADYREEPGGREIDELPVH